MTTTTGIGQCKTVASFFLVVDSGFIVTVITLQAKFTSV